MKRIPLTVTWIHVSDSLPQPGDFVFVAWTAKDGTRLHNTALYRDGEFQGYDGPLPGVDFWMPIPVLPEDVVLEDE